MWNWLLCKLRFRIDWTNPHNAPPFVSEIPHTFERHEVLACCSRCGGGSAHAVHNGKRTPYFTAKLTPATVAAIESAESLNLNSADPL